MIVEGILNITLIGYICLSYLFLELAEGQIYSLHSRLFAIFFAFFRSTPLITQV